jgi:hypothetical protein
MIEEKDGDRKMNECTVKEVIWSANRTRENEESDGSVEQMKAKKRADLVE